MGYANLEILRLPPSVASLQPEAMPQSLQKVELEASAAPLARRNLALADAPPPPARPHISWSLPEHKSYLQTSQTHVAVVQRISLPPPDE